MQAIIRGLGRTVLARLALMAIFVLTCTGGSCSSGDPPATTNVLLDVDRLAVRAGFDRLDFTVDHIEVFYNQAPPGMPINEGLSEACAFPNAAYGLGSLGPTGFDMSATGLVEVGGFQAPAGSVTEIRLVIDNPLLTSNGRQAPIKGQLRCKDSEHPSGDDVLRLVPKAPIVFASNDTVTLQIDFDPNVDIFTGEVGAQNGSQGNGHGGGKGGKGNNGHGGASRPASPGLRIAGTYTLEVVPDNRNLIIPGLVLVTFKAGVTDADVAAVNASVGANLIWRPFPFAEQIHVFGDEVKAIETLQADSRVNAASPELRSHTTTCPPVTAPGSLPVCPSDIQSDEWYLQPDRTDTIDAWNLPQVGSRSTIIAVLDTGIDLVQADLVDNIFINEGELPAAFTKLVGGHKAADFDGDGVITFHDFNNPGTPALLAAAHAFLAAHGVKDTQPNGMFDPVDFLTPGNGIVNGVDDDHDVLGLVDDIVGWDFSPILDNSGTPTGVPGNNRPSDDSSDSHGTIVASVAAAVGNNAIGIAGMMWNARILPLKTHAANGTGNGLLPEVTALKYAQSLGAAVANHSAMSTIAKKNTDISFCASDVHINPTSSNGAFDNVVQQIGMQWDSFGISIPVVASVENCALNWDSGNFFGFPAMIRRPNIISVTATDRTDAIGVQVGMGANSIDIGAPGVSIWVLTGSTSPIQFVAAGGRAATSLAAPLVSGAIGLMVTQKPALLGNGAQIRTTIVSTGSNNAGTPRTAIATRGGRLNAFAAVTAP